MNPNGNSNDAKVERQATLDQPHDPKSSASMSGESSYTSENLPSILFEKTSASARHVRDPSIFPDIESGLRCPDFNTCLQTESRIQEHFRDIDFLGPITLHRLFVVFWVVGTGAAFFFLQNWIWPPTSKVDRAWSIFGAIWLIPLPAAVAFLAGALWFRYNTKLDDVPAMTHNVVFRIVSRGINPECLLSTIQRCQQEMKCNPMFPYLIEVVTDGDIFDAPDEPDFIQLRVPTRYEPPSGAKFKARALHYACQYSVVSGDTWVVHLDEESQITSSIIKGIAKMVSECERTGDISRIGQGMILYHRSWGTHPLLTLADMRRTGDDLGHFYLQHRIGYTIFGLHGSFVVCRQDTEASIGFDIGPKGSITEDAWWVLLAMQKGYRTKWVDGYMEEQSTQTVVDFLKQRRRWYVGLWKVVVHCPVKFRHRIFLLLNTVSWVVLPIVLPLQIAYLVLSFVYNKPIMLPVRLLSNLVFSTSTLVYLSGLIINMRERGTPWWQWPLWIILQIVGLPFFFLMEVASILMALMSPFSKGSKGFHIVEKSGSAVSKSNESTN